MLVGLGNPGKRYEKTPHNIGFNVIDEIAERFNCSLRRSFRYKAWSGKSIIGEQTVLLLKPATYMNKSGDSVRIVMAKNGIQPNDITVIFDDVNLEPGQIRIRKKGGAGGHNGVKSLIEQIGSEEFTRIRIGVGGGQNDDLTHHVLGHWTGAEWREAVKMIQKAADAALSILENGADKAMNDFN